MKVIRTIVVSPNAPDINSIWLNDGVAKYFNDGKWTSFNYVYDEEDVNYNKEGNIVLKEGTKVLGTNENSQQHELLGLGEYNINGTIYDQIEVGSATTHLNLNTNNDPTYGTHPTVDTPEGKKIIAYSEDIPEGALLNFNVTYFYEQNHLIYTFERQNAESLQLTIPPASSGYPGIITAAQNTKLNTTPKFWWGTQEAYDAITFKENNTIYGIKEAGSLEVIKWYSTTIV